MAENTQQPPSPFQTNRTIGGGGAAAGTQGGGTQPQQQQAPPPGATPQGYVAAADVERMINDALAKRDTQQQQQQSMQSSRDRFITDKMKDLPETYRRQLPQTDDLHALAEAEQKIRGIYQADFKAAGGKVPDVGGAVAGSTVKPMQVTAPQGDPTTRLGAAIDSGAN